MGKRNYDVLRWVRHETTHHHISLRKKHLF